MAVTLNGRVRTANDEDAAGTVTVTSTGASVHAGLYVVADSSGPVTLGSTGTFSVPWVPGTSATGAPATVTLTFALTNGVSPAPLTISVPDTDGATINVFDHIVSAVVPADTTAYVTADTARASFVTIDRVGGYARTRTASDGRTIVDYGVAPVGFDGKVPGNYFLDPSVYGPGYALGYDSGAGRIAPIRVDDHFRGYVTSPPTELGAIGDFFRNSVVATDGAFVREWVCAGGSTWLPVVVNGTTSAPSIPTTDPTTPGSPTTPDPGVYIETFSTDGDGWGPDLPWTFVQGNGLRSGGYGLMAGGFTVPTLARMETPLTSPNHSVRLTWVSALDTANRSVGVCTRFSASAADFYVFEVNKSLQRFTFQKIVGGQSAYTSGFQSLPSAITVPLTMELRSGAGGVHQCYINDVLVATYNIADPALDSNVQVGAWQYNGGSQVPVDNITARSLA